MFKMNKMEHHNLWNKNQNQKIFNSNGSFFNFYPNFLKTSVIHKMRKKIKPFKYPKEKLARETDHFVILPKLTQNFLQFQNEQIKIG